MGLGCLGLPAPFHQQGGDPVGAVIVDVDRMGAVVEDEARRP